MGLNRTVSKIAYGMIFTLAAPAGLWWWAHASAHAVHLPALYLPDAGLITIFIGVILMVTGMMALWRHGGGLPMNAFPPPRYVNRGIYAAIPHPIYIGFVSLCLGWSIWTGSASGLWLVTPCTMLALWALVAGYERKDLQRRFGSITQPWLALPPDDERPATWSHRLTTVILVFLPWLTLYEAIHFLGRAPDAFTLFLPSESSHTVWAWTEWIYASDYLVPLMVLFPRTARDLRHVAVQSIIATGVLTVIYLCLPVISPALPFEATGLTGVLLQKEREWSIAAVAAFPSFHVVWAFLAAGAIRQRWRQATPFAYGWATAVAVSCCTTGMHAVLDVLAGAASAWMFTRYDRIWEWLRVGAEKVAASRREWRFGPMRIINHGIYAGIGAGFGIYLIGYLAGTNDIAIMLMIGCCGLTGAALWAQFVEGSPQLLRPFGYYGSVYGCGVGLLLGWACGADVVMLLGAFAAAAPFIQAWGRLRCLVQGCCHGHPAPAWRVRQ